MCVRNCLIPSWADPLPARKVEIRVMNILSFLPNWHPSVYIALFLFLCVLIILESSHLKISKVEDDFEKYKNEPPQMIEIGKLHSIGVVLRNKYLKINKKNSKDLPVLQKEYEDWKKNVVSVVSTISASQAQLIETLNRTPDKGVYKFEKAVNEVHRRDLRTLEKRLEIIEKIIYKYSGLK